MFSFQYVNANWSVNESVNRSEGQLNGPQRNQKLKTSDHKCINSVHAVTASGMYRELMHL